MLVTFEHFNIFKATSAGSGFQVAMPKLRKRVLKRKGKNQGKQA